MTENMNEKKIRIGFTKINESGDWKLDNGVLIWKNSTHTSIKVDDLPILSPESRIEPCKLNRQEKKRRIVLYKNPKNLTKKDRYTIMKWSLVMDNDLFYTIANIILPSTKWTDDEKLSFLWGKLPRLSGFVHGKKVQKLLSNLKWNDNKFRQRMKLFYSSARKYSLNGDDSEWQSQYDEATVMSFGNKVILYRGFNVPPSASIRDKDTEKWFKQETGESVYYSIDENVASRFACVQKYQMINVAHKSDLSYPDMLDLIKGKIAVARYQVDINDIILFDDVLGRSEGECICLPQNVDLLDYKFLGFDDFINILKSKNPRTKPKIHSLLSNKEI